MKNLTWLTVVFCVQTTVHAGCDLADLTKVPKPILAEHPQWVELYYAAFNIATQKVQYGTYENGFVECYMDEAFSGNIFQWDTNFMMFFGKYSNGQLPSIVSLENFYSAQDSTGWICREIYESNGQPYWPKSGSLEANCSINPPLFSWAEWDHFQLTADTNRFKKLIHGKSLFTVLVDYYQWIKENRQNELGLYWTTSYANGMDRSPRLGTQDVCDHASGSWIDISAQQALNALYLAKIAQVLDQDSLKFYFQTEHRELSQRINAILWDKNDGFYYDLDSNLNYYKTRTPASFWTIIAEVADGEQISRLIKEHITNPDEFWTPHHIPTVAKNDPGYRPNGGYWDGAVWAPTTYQTIKGLQRQGYDSLAHVIAKNHIENIEQVYQKDGTIYENYHQESVAKGVHARRDFVGWSGLGPIACLIENVIGLRVDAPNNQITWDLRLKERHGLHGLILGKDLVSLVYDNGEILVETEAPFTLIIHVDNRLVQQEIAEGRTTLNLTRSH